MLVIIVHVAYSSEIIYTKKKSYCVNSSIPFSLRTYLHTVISLSNTLCLCVCDQGICTERAFSQMSHIVTERVREQKFPDPNILDLEDVQVSMYVCVYVVHMYMYMYIRI